MHIHHIPRLCGSIMVTKFIGEYPRVAIDNAVGDLFAEKEFSASCLITRHGLQSCS
jgi:hypothetical protein